MMMQSGKSSDATAMYEGATPAELASRRARSMMDR